MFLKLLTRLLLPSLAFLVIGVPFESYMRGLPGVFEAQGSVAAVLKEHLFREAAACIYSITVLFEIFVILSRPHMRSSPNVPFGLFLWWGGVLALLMPATYLSIRSTSTGTLNLGQTEFILVFGMIATGLLFLAVHGCDYLLSEASTGTVIRKKRVN